ncbi:MAG: Ldh family oxidoreductase [bacterium]|nr:Ldh family oxidoreductase [bacterium]
MNTPPEEFVRVSPEALRSFALACLQVAGMNTVHAEQLARLLVDSDLRGVRSHGTRSLRGYAKMIQQRQVNPDPQISIIAETDTSIHIDGDGSLGYAPTMLATEKCIEKAKAKGTAVGAIQCIGHYGSAGHYVRRAMAEGLIGFSVQSASPQYYANNEGRRAAHYGNPPMCFGLPSAQEPPVVLDVATCILADYQRGEQFEALEELIPAAFFKSMGFTAIGTALGGAFVGQATERAGQIQQTYPAARLGGMIWLVDASLFVPGEMFRGAVDDMVRLAREQLVPMRGYTESTLPGSVEHRLEQEYGANGIKMGQLERDRLTELGTELGVEIPW